MNPKKIAITGGALVASLLLVLIVAPFLFRDRIAAAARDALNDAADARIEWGGVGLSLIRSFPNLNVRLDDLTVTGSGAFEGDTLASFDRLRLVLDISSVWGNYRRGEPVVVRSVDLDRPVIHLRVLEDGRANWDVVTRERDPSDDPPVDGVDVSLRRLTIGDGTVTLDDRESGLFASVAGLQQSLRGDFARDVFGLETRAKADQVSMRFGGVPWLNGVAMELAADLDVDMVERRFTFRDNELRLNDLAIAFSGSAAADEDKLDLDVAFAAPGTDFRQLLSLVPAIYAGDFASLQTSGRMAFSGTIQGPYGPDAFPRFSLRATVEDGTFRYPDLALPARDIALDLSVENPGGDLDRTVVDVSRFHVVIGNDPIQGSLAVRTPVSDPDVDLRLAGRLDLGDLRRTIKLEDVQELAGVVSADAAVRTRMSYLDTRQYDRITASGGAEARNVTVRAEGLPHAVAVEEAVLRLSPQHAELASFRARIGESDLRMVGQLDNVLGYALRSGELRGRATLDSERFDLNAWRSGSDDLDVVLVPGNVDFTFEANIGRLTFGTLEMSDARGVVRVDDRRVRLQEFSTNMLGGAVVVTGAYETSQPGRPTFDVDLRMRGLEIPAAFAQLATVRTFAPIAGYAGGEFSADLALRGAFGPDMVPEFGSLAGRGSIETTRLALENFPGFARLADAIGLEQMRNPTLNPVRASFDLREGRMHVIPFETGIGDVRLMVNGSNGIDQSIQYDIRLHAPREMLGSTAERAITGLLTRAGRAGIDLDAAEVIELGIRLTGTVADPTVTTDVGEVFMSARQAAQRTVEDEAARRLAELDAQAAEARAAARADAERRLRLAEERAAAVMAEAHRMADALRQDGYARADSLLARATDPVARTAARLAADRLRRETDEQADRMLREAERRAANIVEEARGESEPDT